MTFFKKLLFLMLYLFLSENGIAQVGSISANQYTSYISSFCTGPLNDSLKDDLKLFASVMMDIQNALYADARQKMEMLIQQSGDSLLQDLMGETYGNILFMLKDWEALSLYLGKLDDQKKNELQNFHQIIRAFSTFPTEQIIFSQDTATVQVKQKFASKNPFIPVGVNGKKKYGVFDSGAGISLVSESFARKNGIVVIDTVCSIAKSASDKDIVFKPGYINEIQIGNIIIKNHPVGIVDDRAMEFKMIGIKIIDIDFVIGWPIIQEFAIELNYTGKTIKFMNPELTTDTGINNFFWYNIPMVKATEEKTGFPLFFELDLGGDESNIFEPIINKLTDTTGIMRKNTEFGSAGGFIDYETIIIPLLQIKIDKQLLEFEDIRTRPKVLSYANLRPDGVLGGNIAKGKILSFNARKGYFRLKEL